eukprot:TRINITY_DN25343_c0_g1_i3.p1 TRINITY_DN25343_c0_g1~~TRINITY_DN25343_c0_g1_i3.p1  ORF type:complete len:107 (-),score=8.84 TRINITY_DN25343_c0_g1_i3:150-470(-)
MRTSAGTSPSKLQMMSPGNNSCTANSTFVPARNTVTGGLDTAQAGFARDHDFAMCASASKRNRFAFFSSVPMSYVSVLISSKSASTFSIFSLADGSSVKRCSLMPP